MTLHANKLWDTRKAQPTDPLLAVAATTTSSPSRNRVHEWGSKSPAHHNQSSGPVSSCECDFHNIW